METVVLRNHRGVKRAGFIKHKGNEILVLDFSHSTVEEGAEVIEEGLKVLGAQPDHSLLLLIDVTNAELDSWLVKELKYSLAGNEHRIKKQAIVGINEPQEIAYFTIARFLKNHSESSGNGQETGKGFPRFSDIEQAKDWLVSDRSYLAISLR